MLSKFMLDPLANTIAVIVLAGMIFSVISVGILYIKGASPRFKWPKWVVPVLAVIGLCVALYLTYVETAKVEAVCGPVGDCNSVQQSPYAYLFGVIPVGVFGAMGYLGILVAWLIQRFGPDRFQKFAVFAIWGMSWFGVLYSIYLTFLEPFVIGATCVWCITSAILITLLLWASTTPALEYLQINDSETEGLDIIAD